MINILSNSGKLCYGWKDYVVDFETDVANLPTNAAHGSRAFVIATSQYYMLNSLKTWVKINLATSGGSGGEEDPGVQNVIYNGGTV